MTSTIKVNNIQNQCGQNIINENSNTITIGASGDTIALASGASQTGFGRTGTVDWQTGDIKTATFTAANGEGYFANTSGGAFTMNLPAGSAGAIVSVVDYTNTFQTNNLTISPNGSEKIGGVASSVSLETEGQSVTFVYVDGTEGWKNIQDSTSNVIGTTYIVATGGTITTCGNDKIHTFTGPGTFTVCSISSLSPNNEISYLVVAGGGGGGYDQGGGGGAGGFREDKSPVTPYTASPLDGAGPITVTATSFPITVGSGGAGRTSGPASTGAARGSDSVFSTITSAGGGGGNGLNSSGVSPTGPGGSGSGGGGANTNSSPNIGIGGSGNTPPTSPSQGNSGGNGITGPIDAGGGGGGAGGTGTTATTGGGPGGAGATTSISSSPTAYAGGGGGASANSCFGAGGPGGGGQGGSTAPSAATNGTANTGGGGGGGQLPGASGGSGIVIIRYKYQ